MPEADELFKDTGGTTQPQKKSEADSLFAAQAGLSLDPKRPSASDNGGNGDGESGHGDIDDIMATSHKRSDIEIVIAKLFPEFPVKWLNALLVSRVFPDAFNHMQWLCVKELVATTKMTVVEAVAYVYAVLSIAIDGEGRIDGIHIIGQGGQPEEAKAKTNAGMV
jgi:hypothetical protein